MGFWGLNPTCVVCGNNCGIGTFRYVLKDKDDLCQNCYKAAGFNAKTPIKKMTPSMVRAAIASTNQNKNELAEFTITKEVAGWLKIDELQKKWYIPDGINGKTNNPRIHNFDDVIDFELLEDGNSITKGGLGRAAVGGILFGGFGAVVGGVTGSKKSKSTCTTLKIKITLKDMSNPTEYINLISSETRKDGLQYRIIEPQAQECLSLFQLMCESNQNEDTNTVAASATSTADEIRKFKELLDLGAITQKEYDERKRQLLSI